LSGQRKELTKKPIKKTKTKKTYKHNTEQLTKISL